MKFEWRPWLWPWWVQGGLFVLGAVAILAADQVLKSG